jgi:outer membrane protein
VQAADLSGLTQQALAQNPSLRAAQASLNATQETQPQARAAARLPNVILGADANLVQQNSDVAGDDSFTQYGYSVSLVQPLYHPEREARLRQTDAQISAAEASYQTALQSLILQVAESYFAALAAQDDRNLAKAEQSAITRQLDQAQQRFQVGISPVTDVNEAQASYDLAQAAVIAAENGIAQALAALGEIAGEFALPLAKLGATPTLQAPPESLATLTEAGLLNSPSIRAALQAVRSATEEVALQGAGKSASVDAIASHGYDHSSSNRGDAVFNTVIGVQLSVPLYQGGVTDSRTRQARFQLASAQESLEQARRATRRSIGDSYRGITTAINRVQALEQAVRSGESALTATNAGLEAGTRTVVDVLNVQRDLFRVKRDLARERYNYLLGLLRLARAGGKLAEADVQTVNQWLQE